MDSTLYNVNLKVKPLLNVDRSTRVVSRNPNFAQVGLLTQEHRDNSTSETHFGEKESSLNDEIGFGEKLIVKRIPLLHSRENG